jgi:hypothetical protein
MVATDARAMFTDNVYDTQAKIPLPRLEDGNKRLDAD